MAIHSHTVITADKSDKTDYTARQIHRGHDAAMANISAVRRDTHPPYVTPADDREAFGFWWTLENNGTLPSEIEVISHVFAPYRAADWPSVQAYNAANRYTGALYAFRVNGLYYHREHNTFRASKTCRVS